MRSILFVLLILFSATISAAEDILVAFHTTDSKLVVLKVNFANNKYTVVDRAVFSLTSAGGLTALAPLSGGNYQVAWNQRDTTNKIKAFSMSLGPTLDAIGTTKTFPPALTSFYNFNMLPDGDQFSIDQGNNVMLRSRASNGNMGGSQGKLFTIPAGFDPFDTSFTKRGVGAANTNTPTAGDEIFFSLGYIRSLDKYGFAMFAPGNSARSADASAGPVFGTFSNTVVSGQIITELPPGADEFEVFQYFFIESFAPDVNSPAAPRKLAIKAQKIETATLRPVGSSVSVLAPKPADLLGTLPFFNMFTVINERTAVSAAKSKAASGAHLFYVEQISSCRSTSLKAFHVNLETAKKNSGISTLLSCNDPIIQPGSKFLYGLSAEAIPGS